MLLDDHVPSTTSWCWCPDAHAGFAILHDFSSALWEQVALGLLENEADAILKSNRHMETAYYWQTRPSHNFKTKI